MSAETTVYHHAVPSRSDFLVYWTGKDIDATLRQSWTGAASSTTDAGTTQQYLSRLKSILKYGLWMNKSDDEAVFCTQGHSGCRPDLPRVCFTELKLSEARAHAARYGRLGIGFKRPFVVKRGGLPVLYYPQWSDQWVKSLGRQDMNFGADILARFLKRMGPGKEVCYDYLNESEWRIVFSPWLESSGYAHQPTTQIGFMAEHGGGSDSDLPRYLLPVENRWLAMIIYPSIQAKHAAQEDEEIREILRVMKPSRCPKEFQTEKTAPYEEYVLPMEVGLDDCRNF